MILTMSGTWSKRNLRSGKIEWELNSSEELLRNIRLMTEFTSFGLSIYLIETWITEEKSSRLKDSVISKRRIAYIEWWGNEGPTHYS